MYTWAWILYTFFWLFVESVFAPKKQIFFVCVFQETKIGKVVNDLRRKIKNEKLAKRLKQLVRNWRTLLDQTAPTNGTPRLSQQQSSPSVSPAISTSSGTPAQSRNRSNTPTQLTQQITPLITKGNKSGFVVGSRGISPNFVERQRSSFIAQKVASPVFSASHHRTVVTPSASGPVAPPGVLGRLSSPVVSGHVASSGITSQRLSQVVTSRNASPTIGIKRERPNPLVSQSPNISPALHLESFHLGPAATEENSVSGKHVKGRKAAVGELGRLTPTSLYSENSQDRLSGIGDNCRLESDNEHQGEIRTLSKITIQSSDNESSCSSTWTGQSHMHSHNHSTDVLLSNLKNKSGTEDQRDGSKTDLAGRKRTRVKSPDTYRLMRLESSSLSDGHKSTKVVNGHVKKARKKDVAGLEVPQVTSPSLSSIHKSFSSPVLSDALCDSPAALPQSDLFLQQENSDSRLSAPTLDKPSRDKHKVKTTEQLIEELQKKNKSSSVGNTIITKLRTNQIEKERDVLASVLPAGVRPRGKRGRRKNDEIHVSVPSSDVTLSQVKNELVERFLKTSDPSSVVDEYNPFKDDLLPSPVQSVLEPQLQLGACSSSFSKDSFDAGFSGSRQDHSDSAPKDESSLDAISPPIPSTSQVERSGSALTLEEIYAQLPPVDNDIDWDGVDFFELPEQTPVSDECVDRLHSDHLPGINGLYDINREWTSWQQTMTLPSFEGDHLHILPYVDLDNWVLDACHLEACAVWELFKECLLAWLCICWSLVIMWRIVNQYLSLP